MVALAMRAGDAQDLSGIIARFVHLHESTDEQKSGFDNKVHARDAPFQSVRQSPRGEGEGYDDLKELVRT